MKIQSFIAVFVGIIAYQWAMGFTVPSRSEYQLTGSRTPLVFPGQTTVDFTIAANNSGLALDTMSISEALSVPAIYTANSLAQPVLLFLGLLLSATVLFHGRRFETYEQNPALL